MGYLDKQGLQRVWDKIKSLFASSLSFSNRTLTLKNKNGDTLSSVELPYRGIYFVKGTQTAATGTWKGALPEVESLYDGLTIAYFLPYAGSGDATLTLTLKDSTTKAEPVYYNNSSRATTHYGAGATVVLTWISNATSGYTAVGSATGRWTRADYNSNTYTSAVCTTAAGTAAKTATCTDYALLSNSYVHVLIKNSNTIKSALTLSINGKTAKPIYINGTASSANNYTLPAGTYIVFYDGTNYYFNTNGNLPGHIDVNTISSVLGVAKGGTGITSNPSMLVNLASTTADTVFEESPRPGVTGTLSVGNGGTGQTSAKNAANAFINALDTETTALQDGDYFIAQTASGGTTTTTYKRKALSLLSDYIEDKIGGNYLPLAGGQMTGPLTWKNGTALPAKTSDINYLLTIDSFSDGGTTKYATIANVANAIAPTVETVIENDYTFLTKKTDWEIPEEADLNTYTTPGIYICRDKTRATSLFNSPCQRGFSLTVLATLLNDSSISGVIQIVRMFTSHANSLPNQPVYTWQRKWYSNTWSDWVCTSGTMAPMSPGMGTDTTVQFTDINFEAAKYGLGSMFHFSSVNGTTTVGNPRASANILQMNYVAATGYDTQLALGQQGKWLSFRGQYQGRWSAWNYVQTLNFGTCTTAAATAAKTVTLNSHVSATTGTEITILFTNGNQATEPKLTINLPNTTDSAGTTYTGGTCGSNVAIYYQGKPVEPGYIKPGDVVRMIYYSSKWHIVGCINSVTSYGNHVLYHIKCDSGNDDNDGLTESTAFKTLDKFFEVTANSGYTDCRCRLDQAGDYFLNKQAANNITWHCRIGPSVTSTSVPVRIVGNYGVEESWIMYNSHIKLSGRYPKDYKSTDTANIPLYYVGYDPGTLQGIYFENCAVTLENVIFNCTVRTFGCYVNATKGLTAYRLYLYGSDGIVEDLEIEATSNGTNPAIQVWRGSSIRFSSPNSNNTLGNSNKEFGVKSLSAAATNPKNIFLDIRDSSVVLASKMPQGLTNPYYFGIKCVNAELTGKRAVLGTFQTGCVAGQIAADEETELNVSWGEPAFNSIYGVESVQITTPENAVQIPANAIKTWTIEKATIQTAIKAAHSYSTFPYQILAIIPSFTSDNRVIIKNALEDTSTGNVTVIGRNVSSSAVDVGATATVNILYTLKPLNIIKQS